MLTLKKIFLALIFLIQISNSFGQDTLKSKKKESIFSSKYSFIPKLEYSYQHNNYLSLGIGYLNPGVLNGGPCNSFILGARGFSLNSDIKLTNSGNFNIVPKLSYEYSFMLVASKVSLGYATNFKQSALVFSPEIGFTAFGLFYIFYGYNLTDKNIFNLSGHRMTLGVNLSNVW